jgi:tRNA A-37 threonylcarbamoyl transferase component Bud32
MASPHHLAPGAVFARDYRVLGLLAEGGMGAVYATEQLSTGRRRALKIMLSELASDVRARARFEQEARLASQIPSEHVVEVVGAGIDETSGTPWLAMELLEGSDLFRWVRERGPLPPDMVWQCFQQLGHALGAAHQRGIVHRDIKPENLFLASSQRVGMPFTLKVLDFGIAKLTQETRAATARTAAMGSPLWMAPEQTEASTLSPATDVWAMGLVAFFLLTGRMYWRAASQDEVGVAAVLAELLVAPLDPPSVRAAQLGVREPLPAGFDAWFARCVARAPSERFPTAAHALAALGPGMSSRVGSSAAVPLAATQESLAGAVAPRVVATVALGVYPTPSGPYGPPAEPSGARPGHGSAPGVVASPSTPQPLSFDPPPHERRGRGATRFVLVAGGLFLALTCAAGTAFGLLHAWQSYDGRTTPPPARVADAGAVGAAAPDAPAAPPDAPDLAPRLASVDGGAPIVAPLAAPPERPTEPRPAALDPAPPEAGGATEAAFAWGDGEAHVFRGTGRFSDGLVADFQLTLNRNGTTLDGFFHWTVTEVPAGSTAYVGQTTDEGLTGSWSPPRCELRTVGTSSSVGVHLSVRENGRVSGRDDSGTRYTGRLAR